MAVRGEANPDPERITVALQAGHKAYLEALARHNALPGGITEAVNGLIRLARGLGSVGVKSLLHDVHPRTRVRTTFLLPIELIDPVTAIDRPPSVLDIPEQLRATHDELLASAEARMNEQDGYADDTTAMLLAIAHSPDALQLYSDAVVIRRQLNPPVSSPE